MATAVSYPHLLVGSDGAMRIGRTRYKVIHLATEHYHHGWSAEELLRQHPDLRPEEAYAALTYFYDHFDEMLAQMKETAKTVELQRPPQPVSRDELLKRKTARGA